MRLILVIHRYLGVVVGLLMTVWCLSGFVMMYQAYPSLTEAEQLRTLEPLRFEAGCCDPTRLGFAADEPMSDFRIEMLAGRPVLRMTPGFGPSTLLDLATGKTVEPTPDIAKAVATTYAAGAGIVGAPRLLGEKIEPDQWTLLGGGRHTPIHHFAFDDRAGSQLYVSGATGEAIQATNARERFLGWIGVVPHWLYPKVLRANGQLWNQVVIWSSVVGVFLTVTGLYVGVAKLRSRAGRWSPYGGLWKWHHLAGLLFGVLTLTWVFSGLMTMNPWGLLAGHDPGEYQFNLEGEVTGATFNNALAALPKVSGGRAVQVRSAVLNGQLHLTAVSPDGTLTRFDIAGNPAPLRREELSAALRKVGGPVASVDLLTREDAYYYGHHREVRLPVWRVVMADAEQTRLYIDAVTGTTLRTLDSGDRAGRWVRGALHGLDLPVLRWRPVWDIVVLPLLAGVTLVCATGFWLSLARLKRDGRTLRHLLRRAAGRKAKLAN